MKSALLVVGVAALAFLLLSFRKKPVAAPVSSLTQQEKDVKKISELGLQAEFDAYKKIQDELPPRP